VLICSYEFALRHETSLLKAWDLVVATRRTGCATTGRARPRLPRRWRTSSREAHKTVLLTATPLQNKLEELYGLVSIFDPDYFYSLDAFRERYVKNRDLAAMTTWWSVSRQSRSARCGATPTSTSTSPSACR
jgi:hypothetical protein